jgi:hypothetical protein
MTIKGEELERLLSEDHVISLIIREVSSIDDFLNLLIARYFSIRKREKLFMDLVTNRLSYSAKINLLRKCEYSRNHKSLRVFPVLERLAFLRNIVAHRFDAMFGKSGIDRIEKRPDVIALLDDFPNHIQTVFKEAWDDLFRLIRTNDMQWNLKQK